MSLDTPDDILTQQIEYYRARATEYDEWFQRKGRYDRGQELNDLWFAEVNEVRAALDSFAPNGVVLEFACGTGLWTRRLIKHASLLTAVDASPEMIAINRNRVKSNFVEYLVSDIFQWEAERQYDVVFFAFWLSHVPEERFAEFWDLVARVLKPGGRVFFVDSRYVEASTATDHVLPAKETGIVHRKLNDGREFDIVKIFHDPDALIERLENLGWQANVRTTETFFLWGEASLSSSTTDSVEESDESGASPTYP